MTSLPGIGPRRAEALAKNGILALKDLIWHLPRAWEDHRQVTPVAAVKPAETVTVLGTLRELRLRRLRGRGRNLVEGEVVDSTGALAVVWFQQPYLLDQLPAGGAVRLHGRVGLRGAGLVLTHPRWEPSETGSPGLLPLYTAIPGISESLLRRSIEAVLGGGDLERELPDPLPDALRRRRGLPTLASALEQLHLPRPDADLDQLSAGRSPPQLRLIFGELYAHQLELARRARVQRQRHKAHRYRIDEDLRQRARKALPFRLTAAQKRVLRELVSDLCARPPMRRLLQGDVGSGKTVIAALLLLMAAESGLQAALLAPTEILAEQHIVTLRRLLGPEVPISLITSSSDAHRELASLGRGQAGIAVGTHSLLQEGVVLRRLGLVVIDEQHRFGVAQRQLMVAKGVDPDLLVMSATPIPRSLALTLYGDLEVSVLDELPPGRRPVATQVVPAGQRREVYGRLRQSLEAGGQAYVVFPRIGDPGEDRQRQRQAGASLEGLGRRVLERLSPVPGALLHGRLPASEREQVMAALRRGDLRLLVATSVIEVGVDLPGATAIVIESAERFGLAQLHQLRGRVGRGEGAAWCTAIHGELSQESRLRLEAFDRTSDGFALAEADLQLRGPGDLLGQRQAGEAQFRWADPARDLEWMQRARRDARDTVGREAGPTESQEEQR